MSFPAGSNWDGQRNDQGSACAEQNAIARRRAERVARTPAETLAEALRRLQDFDAKANGLLDALSAVNLNGSVEARPAICRLVEPFRMRLAMAVVSAADEATRR